MDKAIIIGIDPGLANTGWGVIEARGSKEVPVAYGCVTTDKSLDLPTRLAIIYDNLYEIIGRYNPVALSVEGIYFGANTQSAMLTAQARGAALVACSKLGLEYGEYTPMQIKQALVGTGGADKEQVQYMVRAVLKLDHVPKPDHAADALAAAITHARLRDVKRLEAAAQEQMASYNGPTAKEAAAKFESRVAAAIEKERRVTAR